MKDIKKNILTVKIVISVFLIIFIYSSIDKLQMFVIIKNGNFDFLIIAFMFYFVSIILRGLKYHSTISLLGYDASVLNTVIVYFKSVPFFLVPGVGEDFYRADKIIGCDNRQVREEIKSFDRTGNLWTLFLLSFIGGIWLKVSSVNVAQEVSVLVFLGTAGAGFILLFIVFFLKKKAKLYKDISKRYKLIYNVLLGILVNFIGMISFYFLMGIGFGVKSVPIAFYMFLMPYFVIFHSLPVTYAGFGAREAGLFFFLQYYKISLNESVLMVLCYYLFFIIVTLMTVPFYKKGK